MFRASDIPVIINTLLLAYGLFGDKLIVATIGVLGLLLWQWLNR